MMRSCSSRSSHALCGDHPPQINTQLGTALLNAYKHVPTMGSPHTTAALVARVEALLPRLESTGHANVQTYALVAATHAQVRGSGCRRSKAAAGPRWCVAVAVGAAGPTRARLARGEEGWFAARAGELLPRQRNAGVRARRGHARANGCHAAAGPRMRGWGRGRLLAPATLHPHSPCGLLFFCV